MTLVEDRTIQPRTPIFRIWILTPLILLLLLELALRAFWTNPYSLYGPANKPFRLHAPGLLAYARIDDDIYPGLHRVRFQINQLRAVSAGEDATSIPDRRIALGGSTTECGLLPEGRRWPDLLRQPAHNFGVSGNFSNDSYHNLKYLLNLGLPPVQEVLVMHGVNDLGRYLSGGAEEFLDWKPRAIDNVLAATDAVDEELLPGIRIRDSALLSLIRYQSNNLKGRSYYASLVQQRAGQDPLPPLGEEAFSALMLDLRSELLPLRGRVYSELQALARGAGLRLILLTQPHAYGPDLRPRGKDLRLMPVLAKQKLTPAQADEAMALINNQTRQLAANLGVKLVDMEACFTGGDRERLFYDSVHYTPEGAERFARCVDSALD